MSPLKLYRLLARAEAVTWALLLIGMYLKYVAETTEVGVRIGGAIHGFVFLAYCVTTGLLWIDQKWSFGRFALGVASAIGPFATVPFEIWAERKGLLGQTWRLRSEEPATALERAAAFAVRKPLAGLGVGVVGVAALFGVALLVGPPV